MRISVAVGSINKCLKLGDVFRVSKVDDIYSYIVPLHSNSQLLISSLLLLERVAYKYDDSLPLALVLSVLQAELSNLDCVHEIGLTICKQYLVNTVTY